MPCASCYGVYAVLHNIEKKKDKMGNEIRLHKNIRIKKLRLSDTKVHCGE